MADVPVYKMFYKFLEFLTDVHVVQRTGRLERQEVKQDEVGIPSDFTPVH